MNLTILNGCIMCIYYFFQFSEIIFFSFKCTTHTIIKLKFEEIKNTVRVPSRMKLTKIPVFLPLIQQIYGDSVICFEIYVYFLASEND